jgi:exopolyphosphatase/guanosine-5'-triphosphate,3'-diphosphate pyrophosphatase
MSEIKRLVIDIGTNSVLALLAGVEGERLSVIFDYKKTTKLGQGLMAAGRLSLAAVTRTTAAVANFAKMARYDDIFLLGTEALRIARNPDDFSRAIKEAIGLEPTILTGEKEAELSFLGSLYDLKIDTSDLLLIDVGGGSSELVTGKNGKMAEAISIPIGALKLKEMSGSDSLFQYEGLAKSIITEKIKNLQINLSTNILATGGTITSAAAISAGLPIFETARIHGSRLSQDQLNAMALNFEQAHSRQRESLIPFDPERADLMLPGLGIYLAILGIIGRDSLVVSTGGLRFGAALYPDKIWA